MLYKSKTIYRDLNPVWDESFTLPIEDPFIPVHIKVGVAYEYSLTISFYLASFCITIQVIVSKINL